MTSKAKSAVPSVSGSRAVEVYLKDTVRQEQGDRAEAAMDVLSGRLVLQTQINKVEKRMSSVNIAGYTLLRYCLDDMTPSEASFAGSMYSFRYASPSPKQFKWLRKLLQEKLGRSIEEISEDAL